MNRTIFAVFIALVSALGVINVVFADDTRKAKTQAPQLVALLPASDSIMTLDVRRFMDEAIPQILSADQAKLNNLLNKVAEIKAKTGIDIKQYEKIAVGFTHRQLSPGNVELEPVALARGNFDAARLIDTAKLASKGAYREEKVGDRTIFIFPAKAIKDKIQPRTNNSFFGKLIEKIRFDLDGEVALVSYDPGTIAFGSLPRVRELFEAKSRVSDQLLDLVYRNQNAVLSFGANMPAGMSSVLALENEEMDKNIDVIKHLYGTMDVNGSTTMIRVTARAAKIDQAKDLESFLKGIADVGKILLGGSKGADKKVYVRMIENTRIASAANEVTFDLQVPQTDVDMLLGGKK